MKTYRKIATIQAVQYLGDASVCDAIVVPDDGSKPYIKTLEGNMTVSHGDWICRGVEGEYWPQKPNVFEKAYIEVE